MKVLNIIAIFLGGGIGATLRYTLNILLTKQFKFPVIGTFSANILGCFLIGLFCGLCIEKFQTCPEALKLFITVGFLGGLTTFSTFSNEVYFFIENGKILQAILYIVTSLCVGFLATWLGYTLGK